MTKRTSAKHKIDRRMGENIWGPPKSPVNGRYEPRPARSAPQGQDQRLRHRALRAKGQKLKGYYGDLTEKQSAAIYDDAERPRRGDTSELLIGLLERRLDAIVYRAKSWRRPIFAARQIVNDGHWRP